MFRCSHDSIIKKNINKIMQITAFKAISARRINIRGCEGYKNTFARMESDCTLKFGFKALIKSLLDTKQSNLFLHLFSIWKHFSRHCPVHVLVVFGYGRGMLFTSHYTIM